MIPSTTARQAILGVPLDPGKKPSATGVVRAIEQMDARVIANSTGALIRNSQANLSTITTPAAGAMAWVIGDATVANNGVYENTGTSGSPVWTRRADLPYGYIYAINVGAGTADAIEVTTAIPIPTADGAAEITVPIVATNTSETVTLSINGETPLPVKTQAGNDPSIGGLTGFIKVIRLNSTYRMLSDQASAAVLAGAEAAAAAALADADRAEAAAASVVARAWFSAVAALVADNNVVIGYVGSGANFEVSAGNIVEAGGHRYAVAASGASDHHVTTAGGVKLYVLANSDGSVTPSQFGAVAGIVTSAHVALAAMFASAFERIVVDGYYRCDSDITCSHDVDISGGGTLDFSHGTGQLVIAGSATQIADLSGNVSARSRTVTLTDASTVSAFDLLCIYNPADYSRSGHRASYRDGEFVRAHSISTNTISLYGKLYDGYDAADVDIYRVDGVKVSVDDVTLTPNAANSKAAIKVDWGDGVRIGQRVKSQGGLYALIEIQRSYDVVANAPALHNNSAVVSDEYGLVISNSQNFRIIGAALGATRHPVALGGGDYICSVATRSGKIIGCDLANCYDTGAGDAHGICDHIDYISCTFRNQAVLGGSNMRWVDCTFFGDDQTAGPAMYGSEVVGGYFEIINPVIISDGSGVNGYIQLIAYGPNELSTRQGLKYDLKVTLKNSHFDVAGGVSGKCIQVDSRANTAKTTVVVDGVQVHRATQMQAVAFVRDSSGAALPSDGIIVDNVFGPAGMALLIDHTSISAVPTRQMAQTIAVTLACTSGSAQATSGSINFRYPFSKTPECIAAAHRSTDGTAKSTWGSKHISAFGYAATATTGRVAARTTTETNFTSTEDVRLAATFAVREI